MKEEFPLSDPESLDPGFSPALIERASDFAANYGIDVMQMIPYSYLHFVKGLQKNFPLSIFSFSVVQRPVLPQHAYNGDTCELTIDNCKITWIHEHNKIDSIKLAVIKHIATGEISIVNADLITIEV